MNNPFDRLRPLPVIGTRLDTLTLAALIEPGRVVVDIETSPLRNLSEAYDPLLGSSRTDFKRQVDDMLDKVKLFTESDLDAFTEATRKLANQSLYGSMDKPMGGRTPRVITIDSLNDTSQIKPNIDKSHTSKETVAIGLCVEGDLVYIGKRPGHAAVGYVYIRKIKTIPGGKVQIKYVDKWNWKVLVPNKVKKLNLPKDLLVERFFNHSDATKQVIDQ